MTSRLPFAALLLSFALGLFSAALAQEWTRFRGPNGTGLGSAPNVPLEFGPGNMAWRTEIAGSGHSSPVVWQDRLFVTAADPEKQERYLHCVSATDGKLLWTQSYGFDPYGKHQVNSYASSTPTVDADRVYSLWQSPKDSFVVAHDHAGKQTWRFDLGGFNGNHGGGVSLVRYENLLIVPYEQDNGGFLLALEAASGKERWRVARGGSKATYATPCVYQVGDRPAELIFTQWEQGFTAVDAATGRVTWELPVFGKTQERSIASPVVAGDLVIGTCGFTTGKKHTVAVRPTGAGENAVARESWRIERANPHIPTPLVYQDRLYFWNDAGIVTCFNTASGEQVWQERLGSTFACSPICIDGRLWSVDVDGLVTILTTGDKFQKLGHGDLGDSTRGTPAVSHGRVFFRTDKHLMALGKK